jgi:hypothetical protein
MASGLNTKGGDMATFKLGQRVRKVCHAPPSMGWKIVAPVGAEGHIIEIRREGFWRRQTIYIVSYDFDPRDWCHALRHQLRPVQPSTDASEFLARIKRMVREPLPLDTNQLESIKGQA